MHACVSIFIAIADPANCRRKNSTCFNHLMCFAAVCVALDWTVLRGASKSKKDSMKLTRKPHLVNFLSQCILASVVVVALKGMLMQVTDFPRFKNKSKMDGFVWMATFLAVAGISIDIGLLVGIVLSVMCIFCNSLKAQITVLGSIPNTDLFLDIERFEKAIEIPFVKIVHYSGSINFATKAAFRNGLCNKLGINLLKELKYADNEKSKGKKFISNLIFNHLCLDFSALSLIDPSSVNMLTTLIKDFNRLNVRVSVVGCSSNIYEILIKNEFEFINVLFPTIHDAIQSH